MVHPAASGVYGVQNIFSGGTGIVFGIAGFLQLCIAGYAIRLNRLFGTSRVGWSLFWAFLLLALLHVVQAFVQNHPVTTFEVNLEVIYVLISLLLLTGMIHLHSILGEQTRLKRKEQRMRDDLESEVQRKTAHLNKAIAELEAQVEERRRAEEQVREQAKLLDLTHDAIIVQDLEGHILYWNKGAENTYGWTASEAAGQLTSQLWSVGALTFQLARKTACEKGRWEGETSVLNKYGQKVLIDSDWTLVCDPQGAPKFIMIVSTDITDKRRLEIQTLRSQRLESIGTLASGIAHDLNNVLTPLLISVQFLKEKCATREEQKLLDTMRSNVLRGARLIKQILVFGRGIKGDRAVVTMGQLAQDIKQIVHDTFPKSLEFESRVPSGIWTIIGDATQIHQVLLNLFVNARDAMPNGGRLTLQMENVMIDELYASKNPEAKPGPYVLVSVTDTGTGIPEEIVNKIFEPFFTTKEHGKGTGLGLSTCFTIVKSHGGFINCYSELGKGSAFKVYLPANPGVSAAEGQTPPSSSIPRGKGELILIVDDERPIREFAQLTLEHFGYRTLVAANGAEAVSLYLIHQHEIAVVLTDMAMPVMDGPSAIAALKSINRNILIIGTSGLEPVATGKAGIEMVHFISKPYTTDALLQALHCILHREPAVTAPTSIDAAFSPAGQKPHVNGKQVALEQG